jgi:divalent metal cation (Fe/Co/Zn/Cd) transporter
MKPMQGLQAALRLERISLGWMLVEAIASIGAGLAAKSLLLVAFGADSVIELISAGVLYQRLQREATSSDMAKIEALEQRASRIGGYLLYALSAFVVIEAGDGLIHRQSAQTSWIGLAVALIAAFGMPVLARAKIRVADAIGSRALRADAMETFTCGYLSWALLAGLALNALLHWWWLDAAASLAIVPLLIKEGREAFAGGCCCHD